MKTPLISIIIIIVLFSLGWYVTNWLYTVFSVVCWINVKYRCWYSWSISIWPQTYHLPLTFIWIVISLGYPLYKSHFSVRLWTLVPNVPKFIHHNSTSFPCGYFLMWMTQQLEDRLNQLDKHPPLPERKLGEWYCKSCLIILSLPRAEDKRFLMLLYFATFFFFLIQLCLYIYKKAQA